MSDTGVTDATPALEAGHRQRILDRLTKELGDQLVDSLLDKGDLWIRVDRAAWHKAVEVCQRQIGLTHFVFLSGLDWQPAPELSGEKTFSGEGGDEEDETTALEEDPEATGDGTPDEAPTEMVHGVTGGETRFQVFCRLYDTDRHVGVTLKADLDSDEPTVDTVVDLFRGADWHEREAWEMFGFAFAGHPGLRHLYLPGAFEGHPLRKDFPLLAREVKPWPGLVNVEQIPDDLDPKKIEAARQAAQAASEPESVESAESAGPAGGSPEPGGAG